MSSTPEITAQQLFDTINYKYKQNNSYFNYNEFAKQIEENDNKKIEESEVYILLANMLSEEKTKFKETLSIDTSLYRGRIVDITRIENFSVSGNRLNGLDKFESKEPPLHTAMNGRSNIAGASYLYVATDKYTAVAECKPLRESFLSVAEFKTTKELKIFNLCDNDSLYELKELQDNKKYLVKTLVELIMRAFYNSVYEIDSGYKISQYISELVRKHGYDGIAYKSFISNGKNYAIFNCCEANIKFIESEIVQVVAQHIDIVSLNDGNRITNPNNYRLPTKKQCQRFKDILIDRIRCLSKKQK
ncbi:MAG: RES family NAD+ phosphorylase [Clostridia bacterium]|nr:RES family NAD+ phosphorylase [Clostridia bacterium]